MRAVIVTRSGPPEVLALSEWPEPAPGPDQVLVRVMLAGVNFVDILARQGRYHYAPDPPFIPGFEAAGFVEALGPGVTGLRIGQRVAATVASGSYAELAAASALSVVAVADDLPWDQAAGFLSASLTAYHLLTTAGRVQAGESVMVHAAAGAVGTTVMQFARLLGAGLVIGTVGSADKARYAQGFGADLIVDRSAADLAAVVRDLTQGRGVDLVLDPVGGEMQRQSLALLAPLGRLVAFGKMAADPDPEVATTPLRIKNQSLIGFSLGTLWRQRPGTVRASMERVRDWLAAGKYRVDVTRVLPLAEAAAAHALVEGRASRGKMLLRTGAAE